MDRIEVNASSSSGNTASQSDDGSFPRFSQEEVLHAAGFVGSSSADVGVPSSLGGSAPLSIHDNDLLSVVGGVLPPVSCPPFPLVSGVEPPRVDGPPSSAGGGLAVPSSCDDPLSSRDFLVNERGDKMAEADNKGNELSQSLSSSLRRSQRQAAQKGKVNLDGKQAGEKEKPSHNAKSRKSLFPMFISFKRNITQALSPESKLDTEPNSKKTH